MKRADAERIAELLDSMSGLTFYAEEIEGYIPAFESERWIVRGITALFDDVILIWNATDLTGAPDKRD